MTHAVPEWAGTAVAWDPEVPGIDPVCTVPDAGSWTVAFSDFAPLADPIALEMRAESISQLVAGDALRCGACERVESTASSAGADIVAGRDRVTVHGRLREHTGGELAEMVAHLDTSVGGSLEVHAGQDDSVLVAGHMNDRWSGGAAVVAAVADDLVAGGGVRVTAPLDLWVHALMGVEERAATGSADVVLLELAATHYEREYNAGVHIARLAQFTGALYMTARTGFRALMEVSCGVRNLIPAPGAGGAGESPATTPPPAEGGAGAAAASETVSTATARSMHSVADGAARGGDELATLRHAQQGGEAAAHPQQYVAGINRLIDADFAATLDELGDVGHGAEVSELNHSADTAEQLAALQAGGVGGDIPAHQQQALDALLDSIDMRVAEARDQQGIPGRTGDLGEVSRVDADGPDGTHHAGDVADPDTAAPGLDGTPSQSPESDYWEGMYNRLVHDHANVQSSANQSAADPYRAAVDDIADQVLATYRRFGGEPGNLSQDASDIERAAEAHRALEDMLTEALRSSDGQRALDIRDALDEVNELTRLYFEDLTGRWAVSSPLSETYTWDTSWSSSGSPDGSAPDPTWGEGFELPSSREGSPSGSALDPSGTSMQHLDDDIPIARPPSELDDDESIAYWNALERLAALNEPETQSGAAGGATGGWGTSTPRTSGDPGRVSFGQPRAEVASSPRGAAFETPGFRRAQAPVEVEFPFNPRERYLKQLSTHKGLSRGDISDIHRRFVKASAGGEIDRNNRAWESMAFLIGHLHRQATFAGDAWNFYRVFDENRNWPALINLLELFKVPSNV